MSKTYVKKKIQIYYLDLSAQTLEVLWLTMMDYLQRWLQTIPFIAM